MAEDVGVVLLAEKGAGLWAKFLSTPEIRDAETKGEWYLGFLKFHLQYFCVPL
jgi:hypothetical protein